MKIQPQNTIGTIVAADYRTASVFSENQIDFCCKGGKTIEEVCSNKKIDPDELIDKLHRVMISGNDSQPDFASWPADLLADYIEKKHHRYVEQTIPVLKAYLEKIAAVHGTNHPELIEISDAFNSSSGALAIHMKKEELVLFPYIRNMFRATRLQQTKTPSSSGFIKDPIKVMHEEHDREGERFRKISFLSQNYTPPHDACTTYRVAFRMLADFEKDLHMHIHLENNILFPIAMAMEKSGQHEQTH